MLHKFTQPEDWKKLPPQLRFQVEVLGGEIRKAIPNDVDFILCFDENDTFLSLEYSDGNTMAGGGGDHFETRGDLFSYLKEQDWDEFRARKLQGMNIMDELMDAASKRPVNIPSSEKAARRWSKKLVAALAEVRRKPMAQPFVIVYAREGEPLEINTFKNEKDMIRSLMDSLATQYHVLAILENGKELSFPEIEARKRQAIELLGPISRAKAEGRYF